MRLSPRDPLAFSFYGGTAFAHFLARRYDEACAWAEKSAREQPNFVVATRIFAASCVLAGRLEKAKKTIARLRQHNPAQRVSSLKEWAPFRKPEDLVRFDQALREAGLPE